MTAPILVSAFLANVSESGAS